MNLFFFSLMKHENLSSLFLYSRALNIYLLSVLQRVEKAIKEKTCNALLLKVLL